jgi:hypothetical protein
VRIDVGGLAEEDARIPIPAQDAADGRADLAWRERSGRDLVEQRLEQVEVTAVDDGDFDRRVPQRARGIQAAEAPSKNDDAVSDAFRIPERGCRLRYRLDSPPAPSQFPDAR